MSALGGFAQHARAGIRLLYDTSVTDVDIQSDIGSPNGPVSVHISILSGVVISSTAQGSPAFDMSGVSSGSYGLIDNAGTFRGIGGNGGIGWRGLSGRAGGGGGGGGDDVGLGAARGGVDGTTATGGAGGSSGATDGGTSAAEPGAIGGAAIDSSGVSLTIINANGEIHGGGGGGGGGGVSSVSIGGGGAGGDIGDPGIAGTVSGVSPPGAGGAAGHAVKYTSGSTSFLSGGTSPNVEGPLGV